MFCGTVCVCGSDTALFNHRGLWGRKIWEQSQAKSYEDAITLLEPSSPKTLGGRAYTEGRSPSGRSLNGISCLGGLTDTKSGTPSIHIKPSAAEGILTPEGAQASRARGFNP